MATVNNEDGCMIEDDGSSNIYSEPTPEPPGPSEVEALSNKRTRDEDGDEGISTIKRAKHNPDVLDRSFPFEFPKDVWVRICQYLTPFDLARLMLISRAFRGSLESSIPNSHAGAEELWAASRKSRFRSMPEPLDDCSELDMLKIIFSNKCSYCGYDSYGSSSPSMESGFFRRLNKVWAFSVQLCDQCAIECTEEEATLFFSPASILVPLLPFAFLGDRGTFIPTSMLKDPGTITENNQIKKVYFRPMIEKFRHLLEDTRLGTNGKARFENLRAQNITKQRDVAIWEHWVRSGGLEELLAAHLKTTEMLTHPVGVEALHSKSTSPNPPTGSGKSSHENDSNAPKLDLLQQLGTYADEVIQNTWAEGHIVSIDNAPNFAADVLLYVRRRFFSTLMLEEHRETGEKTKSKHKGLVLSDMKWIFDNKIKPVTEPFRKELFLCNGCIPKSNKYYGFEAVIQHFGSKHTDNFRVGNTTVHWQLAEWPENPPFAPDPGNKRINSISHAGSQMSSQLSNTALLTQQRPFPVPTPTAQSIRMMTQQSPGPFAGPSFQGTPLGSHYGPFVPPALSGFGLSTSPLNNQLPFLRPNSFTPLSSQGWPVPSYRPIYSPSLATPGTSTVLPASPMMLDAPSEFSRLSRGPMSQMVPSPGPTLYNMQREEVARIARDVWNATTGIKDVPPSVRVYVVIFHVVSQNRISFKNDPNLDLFEDCVLHNSSLIPLRNVSGLACKTCVLNDEATGDDGPSHSIALRLGGRKLYSFHSLLQHFKSVHIEQPLSSDATASDDSKRPSRLDWKEDMVELPDSEIIERLATANGITEEKLKVIAAAFPGSFPNVLERGSQTENGNDEYDPQNPSLAIGSLLYSAHRNRSTHARTNEGSSVSEGSRSRPRSLVSGGIAARPESGSLSQHGSVSSFAPPPPPPPPPGIPTVLDRMQHGSRAANADPNTQEMEREPTAFYVKTEPEDEDDYSSRYRQSLYMYTPGEQNNVFSRDVNTVYDGREIDWNQPDARRQQTTYDSRGVSLGDDGFVYVRVPNQMIRHEGFLDGRPVELVPLPRRGEEMEPGAWRGSPLYHERSEVPVPSEQFRGRSLGHVNNRGRGRY